MPTWEETKRMGQTAFIMAGNGFEDVHSSVSAAYQQILTTGHIYPPMDRTSLSNEMAINPEYTRMEKAYVAQEEQKEPEQGFEPER